MGFFSPPTLKLKNIERRQKSCVQKTRNLPRKLENNQLVNKASHRSHYKTTMSLTGMKLEFFKVKVVQVPGTLVNPFGSGKQEQKS